MPSSGCRADAHIAIGVISTVSQLKGQCPLSTYSGPDLVLRGDVIRDNLWLLRRNPGRVFVSWEVHRCVWPWLDWPPIGC